MFTVTRNLSRQLTSYDLLKTLAVVLMVVDHLGACFFVDEVWFRVLGRFCVPIWFFLIGYASTRDVPKSFWIGGGVLVLTSFIVGGAILPLPILFTFALGRFCLDGVMRRALRTPETLAGMFFVLVLLSLHSSALFEYGTLGLLLAMYGYMCRHRDDWVMPLWHRYIFISGVVIAFILHEWFLLPGLSEIQFLVFVVGSLLVFILLGFFKSKEYKAAKKYLGIVVPVFQFFGRWSLEFYVVHLVVFRFLAAVLWPDRGVFFDFELMAPEVRGFFFQ